MKRFAVILSGSGVYDGSEIHEAVMTLLALTKHNVDYDIFAPDILQHHVVNHLTGESMDEKRNVLIESARIARGNIKALDKLLPEYYDGLILPGGFGVAKNLSTWAFEEYNCDVNPDFERIIKQFSITKKPIGALCIAPAVVARILGNITVTIGKDLATAAAVEKTGSNHKQATHGEVVVDTENNIFSTPCYMLDANLSQIAEGAENIVKAMIDSL